MYDYKAKSKNIRQLNSYMLTKTLSMFEYENLPETIPSVELERMLQISGYAFITEVGGKLYAFNGGFSGMNDVYGNPTQIVISNPALNFNATLDLNTDGVLISNDSCQMGLIPLYEKANTLLVENDINMVMFGYNTRIQKIISASDDRTKSSAEAYLKKTIDGDLGVIGENAMFDGIKTHGGNEGTGSMQSMIEFNQYIKSAMYSEIGLGLNHNMKRERVQSAEIEQSKDSLYPFIYDMMKNRLLAVEKLNAKFTLNVSVGFGSVWNANVRAYVDDVVSEELEDGSTNTAEAPLAVAEEPRAEDPITEVVETPEVIEAIEEPVPTEVVDAVLEVLETTEVTE